jgi:Domain of unknown function (DUF1902)
MAKVKPKRISPKRTTRIRNKRMALGGKVAFKEAHALEGFERFGWPVESSDATSKVITVKAAWDAEAKVWYTQDSTLPGLNLEAETLDELRNKLPGAIEDLLEGSGARVVPFQIIAPGHATVAT